MQPTQKAAYQILLEDESIVFGAKGSYSVATHEVVRVLTTEGVDQWSVLNAEWQPWRESRPELRARVVRPSGAESTLSAANVVESSAQDGDYNLRSDSKRLSAPLPNLEPGALIEFELDETGKEAMAGTGFSRRIYLAGRGPVEERVVRVEYPDSLPFRYSIAGMAAIEPERGVSNGRVTLVFRFPKFSGYTKFDQLLPYDVPPVPTLTLGTAESWKAVAAAYSGATEPLLDPAPLRAYALAALAGLDPARDPVGAARLVADRLRHDVRYTGIYFGENAILPHAPAATLATGYGDCKDQASLLVACLRAVGIDADLALLKAGLGYDVDPAVPGLELFNHAIVYLPKLGMWIDPTDIYCPAGSLPYSDQGRRSLVIGPETSALTTIPAAGAAANWYRIVRDVALSESGKAGSVVETVSAGGTLEERLRAHLDSAPRKDRLDGLVKAGKSDFKSDEVVADFGDPLDLSKPFTTVVTARGSASGWTGDDSADFLMRGGDVFGELPRELELGAAEHESRGSDVYLPEAMTVTVEYLVSAPDGFHLNTVPDAYSVDMGPVRLDVSFASPDPRHIKADFVMTTIKDRFSPAELDKLRTAAKTFFDSQAAVASFYNVGRELLNAGRYRDALAEFRRLQTLYPAEALHHVQASLALLNAGFSQDALVEARQAVVLEPKSAPAHKNLAFILLYDPFGRQFGPGSDPGAAGAEYAAAFKLDPTDYQSLFNQAVLDEFGSDGSYRGKGSRLADAVAIYGKAPDQIEGYGMAERYLGDLFFLGRYDEVIKASASFKDRANGAHFLFAATAMKSGADAAVRLAGGIVADLDKRRSALNQAGLDLLAARRFAPAAELFLASARGTSNFATTADFARRIRDVKPYDPAAQSASPLGPFLGVLETVLNSGPAAPAVSAIAADFVPAARAALGSEYAKSDVAARLAQVRGTLDRIGLPDDALMDLLASKLSVVIAAQGRAVLAVASLPDFGTDRLVNLMLERKGEGYLLVDANESAGVGAQMLSLIAAGDLRGAGDWLKAMRDSKTLLPAFGDAVPENLRLLLPSGDADAAALSLAAAALSRGCSDPAQARACLKIAAEAGAAAKDPKTRLACLDLALGFAATVKDPGVAELASLQAACPGADAASAALRIRALDTAGLHAQAVAAGLAALASYPGNLEVLRGLRYSLAMDGRHEEALKIGEATIADPAADASDYNNTAWEMLFQARPDFGIIDSWELPQRLGGTTYSLHTLCCLYGAAGRYDEARAAFEKYLSSNDLKTVDSSLWLAHGLLARSFGLPGRAEASLAQAVATGHPDDATDPAALAALWAARP
ncbi:MAG: DUF3857 domain-containing protein [Treponema sp.]|nr:DUF3857 domain-containing protein [Treponema sp.]